MTTAAATESTPTPGVVPEGFATEAAEVTAADGEVCALCLWVAATSEERARGLMGVTDLGGADGMVFVFGAPTHDAFWMRGTPTPLSIAFFADDGSFVSATDMEPCLEGPASACVLYGAGGAVHGGDRGVRRRPRRARHRRREPSPSARDAV